MKLKPLKPTPTNHHGDHSIIRKSYQVAPAMGVPNGLFKESIQNSTGASNNKIGITNVEFENILYDGRKHLLITDTNTTGLTGEITNLDEIEERVKKYGEKISEKTPKDENYFRFCSNNTTYVGDNKSGAGANGKGKLLYQACSQTGTIYVFTVIKQKTGKLKFRAFEKKYGGQTSEPYEGKDAIEFFNKNTGNTVNLIETTGTMIFIENVNEEVWNSIENSFITLSEQKIKNSANFAIQYDWHLKISEKTLFVKLINLKKEIKEIRLEGVFYEMDKALKGELEGAKVTSYKEHVAYMGKDCSVNITLVILPKNIGNEEIMDIFGYRKQMRVGKFGGGRFYQISEELRGRLFGVVTFDSIADEFVIAAENYNHYGFNTDRKIISDTINCIKACEQKFLKEHGYLKKIENLMDLDSKNKIFEMLAEQLKGLEEDLSETKELSLSLCSLNYSVVNAVVDSSRVNYGDNIIFRGSAKNESNNEINAFIRVFVEHKNGDGTPIIDTLFNSEVFLINSNNKHDFNFNTCFNIRLVPGKFQIKLELIDSASMQSICSGKCKILYYETNEPESLSEREIIGITENFNYPNESTKRVELGQEICGKGTKVIRLNVENKESTKLEVDLLFKVIDCEKRVLIEFNEKGVVLRGKEDKNFDFQPIKIDEKFERIFLKSFLKKERLCRIIVKVVSAKNYPKLKKSEADELNSLSKNFYCGIDSEKKNRFSDWQPVTSAELGTNKSRAILRDDGSYLLHYNVSHSHFKIVEENKKRYNNPAFFNRYIVELIIEELAFMSKIEDKFLGEHLGFRARFQAVHDDTNESIRTSREYRDALGF